MLKRYIVIVVGFSALASASVGMAADSEPCVANFAVAGSFLAGKNYKTWQEFPSIAQSDAYKTLYTKVVADGWKITTSDKEMGMLAATQEVSYGGGKAAPMNVLVESVGAGSKVTLTFGTSGMVSVKAKTLQDKFCGYLSAVGQSATK